MWQQAGLDVLGGLTEMTDETPAHTERVLLVVNVWKRVMSITPFDGKWQNLQMSHTYLKASSDRFRDIKIKKV